MSNGTQTAVQDGLASLVKAQLEQKNFSTGSKGFYGQGKIEAGGKRYQAQVMAVLIGSKGNPRMKVQANAEQAKAALLTDLIDKGVPAADFSTGKTGFRTQGKVQIGGQTYQTSVQAVLLAK
jgi:vancomycin permeability regulator SanA